MKYKSPWQQIKKIKNGKYRTPSVKKFPSLENTFSFILELDGFKIIYEGHQHALLCQTILIGIDKKVSLHNNNYVLFGDYRKEYEELSKNGFHACLKFYEKKIYLQFGETFY